MRRAIAALALLLLPRVLAFAGADPVSIETKWTEKSIFISTSGVTSLTVDVGGFGSAGFAILGKTYKRNGVDGSTWGNSEVVVSTTTNVTLFDYVAYDTNTFNIQMAQTVKTPVPAGAYAINIATSIPSFTTPSPWSNNFLVPVISTSAVMSWPGSVALTQGIKSVVNNPVFYITNLNAGSTFYLLVNFGVPRIQ